MLKLGLGVWEIWEILDYFAGSIGVRANLL